MFFFILIPFFYNIPTYIRHICTKINEITYIILHYLYFFTMNNTNLSNETIFVPTI